jgi:hypothetical protein
MRTLRAAILLGAMSISGIRFAHAQHQSGRTGGQQTPGSEANSNSDEQNIKLMQDALLNYSNEISRLEQSQNQFTSQTPEEFRISVTKSINGAKTEAGLLVNALNNYNRLQEGSRQIANDVRTRETLVSVDADNRLVISTSSNNGQNSSDSPREFRAVSSATNQTENVNNNSENSQAIGRVDDLTSSAKRNIENDRAIAMAAVIDSLTKQSQNTTGPSETTGPNSNATSFNDAYNTASGGGGGSSSGSSSGFSSYSPEMTGLWATMNQFNTSNYLNRASSYLGVGLGTYNLTDNPVYSIVRPGDTSDLFRQIALDNMRGKNDANKLVGLATKDGFQDTLKTALGEDGQSEFNLLAAGAAITNNSDLDPSIVSAAQSFINGVLNSQGIINNSAALSGLNSGLGGSGLALLSPETLNWLEYASKLAYSDVGEIPALMRNRRDTYTKGYDELRKFLKNLALGDAVALLNTLKVPVDLQKNAELYQEAHKNFIKAHLEPVKYLKSKDTLDAEEQRLLTFLERISKWVAQVPKHDVEKLGKWSVLMGEEAQGTVQSWDRIEPQSLTLARFFYAQMYYYAYVAKSFAADGKASPMIILIGDAQSWAKFENNKILERRKEKEAQLKKEQNRKPLRTPKRERFAEEK